MEKERSGFLPMAIGLVLVFLGIAMWQYGNFNRVSNTLPPNSTENNPNTADQKDWKIYRDEQYGFSVQYPPDFTITEGVDPGQDISLVAPIKNYFKTILAKEANITISIPDPICQEIQVDQGTPTELSFTGGKFTKVPWNSAGAGNLYEGAYYTFTFKGNCYALNLYLHSTNGAGFYINDPVEIAKIDAQQKTDKEAFFTLADKIVSTFKFTNQ